MRGPLHTSSASSIPSTRIPTKELLRIDFANRALDFGSILDQTIPRENAMLIREMTWVERENWRFQTDLRLIRGYVEQMRSSFKLAAAEIHRKFNEEIEGLPHDEAQAIWDVTAQSVSNLESDFVVICTSNTFVGIYTILEHQLFRICEVRQKEMGFKVSVGDVRGSGIDACRTYLEKVCGIDVPKEPTEWKTIKRLQRLRNVLAHERGRLQESDKDLREYIEKSTTARIGHDNQIVLDYQFCLEVIDTVEQFMDRVTDAIPTQQVWV
jgi:hypothetical protein